MDAIARKELDTLKLMISNWKRGYMGLLTGENDEPLLEDFIEDIDTIHLYPYVYALLKNEHITRSELNEFMTECYQYVIEFKQEIEKARENN